MKGDHDWRPSRERNKYKRKRGQSRPVPPPPPSSNGWNGDSIDRARTPYFLLPLVEAERLERESRGITPADYGTRWRSAYCSILGERPVCGPADHDRARGYLDRIERAIEQGGWTPGEGQRLRKMRETWNRRAAGRDAYFEIMGTHSGKVDPEDKKRIEAMKRMIRIMELIDTGRKTA